MYEKHFFLRDEISKQECIPVGCVPPAHWPYPIVSWGGCLPKGGVCPGDVYLGGCLPKGCVYLEGVPCDLSHQAFDVTCMLSLLQLRLKSNAAAYIVLVMWPDKECWDTPPFPSPPTMWTEFLTHACENITFPQLLLRAANINQPSGWCHKHVHKTQYSKECDCFQGYDWINL